MSTQSTVSIEDGTVKAMANTLDAIVQMGAR